MRSSPSNVARQALVRLLVKLRLLDDQFVEANPFPTEAEQKNPIAFYASMGVFDEADAVRIVAERLSMPSITVSRNEIESAAQRVDTETLSRIPFERWKQLPAVPVERNGGQVRIAVANPLDHDIKSTIEFAINKPITLVLMDEATIRAILVKRVTLTNDSSLAPILEEATNKAAPARPDKEKSSEIGASDLTAPPVVRLLNKILNDAVETGASDIHLSPAEKELVVKVRVDGVLRDLMTVPAIYAQAVLSRVKLLAGLDIAEKRRPQDGRLRVQSGPIHRDIRVSTLPTIHGENIVARVLASDLSNLSMNSLGMPPQILDQFSQAIRGSSRVILVTGPTGSGKTSTLYASILALRDGETHILTIEDPIEYRMEGVNQLQVNSKIGLSFADALRSVLRQDPDVVVVGEIRDKETATIAIQTAQTGHLVLSTLHTNSAPSAVTRLVDLGVPGYLIASSVEAILAQRLVRRLCSACAEAPSEKVSIALEYAGISGTNCRSAGGCEKCGGTGYSGRIGVYSLFSITDEIREKIRTGASEDELEALAHEGGYETLQVAAKRLIENGTTTLVEAERVLGPLSRSSMPPKTVTSESVPSGAVTTPNARGESSNGLGKPRVVLVEDDENMRTILTMILERAMYEVIQAADGRAALDLIYEKKPDIVVSDLMMPTMDGKEMISILRARPETKNIPVLLLTAADSEENELTQLSGGADDFVSKTADKRVFLARIQNLLSRSVR